MQVWHKGASRDVTVVIAELAEEKPAKQASAAGKPEANANRLGLVLSELTAEQKRELKLAAGLVVDEVRGAAARSDLRVGDVILAVVNRAGTQEVKTVAQFNKLLTQYEAGSNVTLLVRRADFQTFVTIRGINGH
jgi:serine protease Do